MAHVLNLAIPLNPHQVLTLDVSAVSRMLLEESGNGSGFVYLKPHNRAIYEQLRRLLENTHTVRLITPPERQEVQHLGRPSRQESQFGARREESTQTSLVLTVNNITELAIDSEDEERFMNMVYLRSLDETVYSHLRLLVSTNPHRFRIFIPAEVQEVAAAVREPVHGEAAAAVPEIQRQGEIHRDRGGWADMAQNFFFWAMPVLFVIWTFQASRSAPNPVNIVNIVNPHGDNTAKKDEWNDLWKNARKVCLETMSKILTTDAMRCLLSQINEQKPKPQ